MVREHSNIISLYFGPLRTPLPSYLTPFSYFGLIPPHPFSRVRIHIASKFVSDFSVFYCIFCIFSKKHILCVRFFSHTWDWPIPPLPCLYHTRGWLPPFRVSDMIFEQPLRKHSNISLYFGPSQLPPPSHTIITFCINPPTPILAHENSHCDWICATF